MSDMIRERTIKLRVSDKVYRAVRQALTVRALSGGVGPTAADASVAKVWEALAEGKKEVLLALRSEGSTVGTKAEL